LNCRRNSEVGSTKEIGAILERHQRRDRGDAPRTSASTRRAIKWENKWYREKSGGDSEGSGHRTKLVATNTTTTNACDSVELFGSGKPKLPADGVGVVPSEAVSTKTAPLSIGEDVDVALVVAKPTDEGNSNGARVGRFHSMLYLGQLDSGGESIVDRRYDRLR